MKYKILRVVFEREATNPVTLIGEGIEKLQKDVQDHINDGWRPVGGADFEQGDLYPLGIIQTMVKDA